MSSIFSLSAVECSDYFKSLEYRRMQVARFLSLYCRVPTDPKEISDETVFEIASALGFEVK